MEVLKNKRILLGVTGSIAIYKSLELVRLLRKADAQVKVMMTKSARELVSPLTFETLSQNPVCSELFAPKTEWEVEHISLARWAELFIIAPATANIIGKLAHGIADDALTTIYLAYRGDVFIAPAMNTAMYEKPVVQRNLEQLIQQGVRVIEPELGELACGEEGKGRLVEPAKILEIITTHFSRALSLKGKKVLVTAGPTREFIDDVRFISNPSSGRMGIAIAEEASRRGTEVILVLGPTLIPPPKEPGITVIPVVSAEEMSSAVESHIKSSHIAVFAAAVADYRPVTKSTGKLKKGKDSMELRLEPTPDIALRCSQSKTPEQIFIGFAAEVGDNIPEAQRKLREKKFDLILLNDISLPETGFASQTNKITLIHSDNKIEHWEKMTKKEIATKLMDAIQLLLDKKSKLK
ncbi:bifunctional phosphopantothenoylcysteine decarboxylase/phosphopantothenate--cysteine ligase CoaBC [Candidatus Sumerlaeota bacterium]|nr:bifunctional phosphopantothenoylcysteine decarboxylase/phosphopantothenate--cysteine ligase CoaBC [Candidatus Sumerlaeota bacterium]